MLLKFIEVENVVTYSIADFWASFWINEKGIHGGIISRPLHAWFIENSAILTYMEFQKRHLHVYRLSSTPFCRNNTKLANG